MSVRGFQMALVCQKVVSQLRNTLRDGALAAKLGIFTLCSFAAVSQLRNGGSCAAKWHSCAKLGFAEESIELRNDFAKDDHFRKDTLIPQRLLLGCETISQRSANFVEDSLRLRILTDPCFCLVFALFLHFSRSERLPFNFFAFSPTWDHSKRLNYI